MKKLLSVLIITLFVAHFQAEAQCTVAVQSIAEDFDGYTGNDLPACWNRQNNAYVIFDQLRLRSVNAPQPMGILPKTVNARGVLYFEAWYYPNWGAATNCQVGVVDDPNNPASFVVLGTFAVNSTLLTPFSFDFSTYTGNFQYIAIAMPTNSGKEIYIDNLTYTSGCVSTSVTAVAQDFTAQLASNGEVTIATADIDNGSSSDCGAPALTLSQTDFDCNDIGVTQVTLTATDVSGNTSTATANVTILAAIDNETVTATSSSFCIGGATTITTGSSASGVSYYLRDDSDNSIVDGPVVGDGNALSFNTGTLNSTTTFNVYASTIGTVASTAIELDGANDYVSAPVAAGMNYAQGFTFESWVKTSLPGNGGSRAIFSAGTTAISDIEVYVQGSTNKIFVVYNRNNPSATLTYYEYPIPVANTWFHLAVSYAGTSTSVYYNGVLQTPTVTQNGSPLAKTSNSSFEFGRAQVSVTHPEYGFLTLLGALDETRIWNVGRTQPQIAAMMNVCAAGTEAGLTQCYSFEDGTGLVATNLVGGSNGTLVNMSSPEDWITGPIDCAAQPDPACAVEMTQTVTITVGDAVAPVADIASLSAINAQCEVTTLTAPTATDNCAGAITGTHNASLPISSNTTITWTYDDGNGNSTVQVQEVVINDNMAPVPDAVSLPDLSAVCEVTVLTAPTATDNCDGLLAATHNATLPITSNQIITWTWNDGSLNSVSQDQVVIITDIDVETTVNGGTITADQTGATYQWVDCDNGNAPISNEDQQSFSPASSGNYAVEVTVNGCTETSGCVNMTVTGITEAHTAELNIFPIPATQLLNVVCSEDVKALHVYAVSGQLLASYPQNTKAIDVSGLSNGMYLLVVQSESGQTQRRFAKE